MQEVDFHTSSTSRAYVKVIGSTSRTQEQTRSKIPIPTIQNFCRQ